MARPQIYLVLVCATVCEIYERLVMLVAGYPVVYAWRRERVRI